MTTQPKPEFGKLRALFWPVRRNELRLFVPLLLMFFFICLNYNVLRAAKDALVVTAPCSGAEAIPFIKVWAILPSAFLVTFLFTRLSNRFNYEKIFYIMMGLFLSFFFLFAFVLYPFSEALHPTRIADQLSEILPLGFRGLIAVFRNWTFTTFYVMSELWGTTIMTVLFWGFANEIMSVGRAKRFYTLLMVGGNLAGAFAGQMVASLSSLGARWGAISGKEPWECSLTLICCLIIVCGLLTIAAFRWFNRHSLDRVSLLEGIQLKNKEPSEIKMGIRNNFKYLAKSKYLLCIAVIVLTYNICINLTEVVWKDQLRNVYSNPNDFNAYMGHVLIAIGIMATLIALAASGMIQKARWTFNAMIPPTIMLITGVGFFTFLLFKDTYFLGSLSMLFGCTPLAVGVFFGSAQNCLARSSKYTIFDTTKELAFIPLSKESKLKGKAAIDGVGSRLGKSGGAVIYQSLLMVLGTVACTIPYVAVILLFIIIAWMWAVKSLGRQFIDVTQQKPIAPEEAVLVKESPSFREQPVQ
ncbi:MAG: NTP/NDP exchange transporter [Simkania sp.]|nr:NTP/NDP exchange transporter [Simkania sp.]